MSRDAETELNLRGSVVDSNVVNEWASKINDVEVCVVNDEVALSALLVIEVLGLEGSGVSLSLSLTWASAGQLYWTSA